jgi:hypothetical protein
MIINPPSRTFSYRVPHVHNFIRNSNGIISNFLEVLHPLSSREKAMLRYSAASQHYSGSGINRDSNVKLLKSKVI